MPAYIWNGLKYQDLVTGGTFDPFTPGVTEPYYEPAADFSGRRNVGTNPNVPLTRWAGTYTAGIAQITDGALYENMLFDGGVVDMRSGATFRNCRFVLPKTYTQTDSVKAVVRILNGSGTTGVVFENCEFHCRAQRPFNGVTGRNATFRRCVITGCIDGFSDSASGGAPQDYGFIIEDCIVPSVAFWYSNPANPDIHSDTISHSDCIQKTTGLQMLVSNTVLLGYVDEFIGTGTPGSGADAGNPYNPPSGTDFIVAQATMESWRAANTSMSTASQSKYGESHRISNGSMVGLMANAGAIDFQKCYFAGGNVCINATDGDLGTAIDIRIENCTFWNDMRSGPGSRSTNPLLKGYAIQALTGTSFEAFTGNKWFDGTALVRYESGGFSTWRA